MPREDFEGTCYCACVCFNYSLANILFSHSTEGEPLQDNIVSWGTFLNFWSKNYSHLIIRRPNADICPDCYIAANILKFRSRKNDNDDDDEDLPELEPRDLSDDDDNSVLGMGIFPLKEREDRVILAGEHGKLAKHMRELFNSFISLARAHAVLNIAHNLRMYMRIGDYCQKMEMAYF
jgi:hypothetical protein